MNFLKKKQGNSWAKRSYSQSGEDLIVRFIFDCLKITKPSYIDIGAHHPFYLSNTAIFYENGCRGINIEPDPSLFKEFTKFRSSDINLNCGVGDENKELTLNVLNSSTLNTFSDQEAEKLVLEYGFEIKDRIKLPVYTVNHILHKYYNNQFPSFLTIDVEGLDEAIINSINFEVSKPLVICIETVSYSETGNGIKNYVIIEYIQNKGYMVFADTYINTIFVLKEKWIRK